MALVWRAEKEGEKKEVEVFFGFFFSFVHIKASLLLSPFFASSSSSPLTTAALLSSALLFVHLSLANEEKRRQDERGRERERTESDFLVGVEGFFSFLSLALSRSPFHFFVVEKRNFCHLHPFLSRTNRSLPFPSDLFSFFFCPRRRERARLLRC